MCGTYTTAKMSYLQTTAIFDRLVKKERTETKIVPM